MTEHHTLVIVASYMGLCLICGAIFVAACIILRDKETDNDWDNYDNEEHF